MSDHELAVERNIAAPPAAVWRAFTDHMAEWWCPKPWTTEVVEADLRPGGRFATVMRGPAGEEHPGEGVILEVVPERRLVFTNAFLPGWRPQQPQPAMIVGTFELAPDGGGTRYRAGARHWDAAAMKAHEAMGFTQGWGVVADQLAEVAERLARA